MINRIIGVLKLDIETFEEIEHAEDATAQAAIIVAIVAVLGAISAYLAAGAMGDAFTDLSQIEGLEALSEVNAEISPIGMALSALISPFIWWGLFSALTYAIGTRMHGKEVDADIPQMLRVLGFGMSPQLLSWIPCIGWIFGIYSLVTSFVGVRQGLDLDNGKTAGVVALSLIAYLAVRFCAIGPIFGLLFGM